MTKALSPACHSGQRTHNPGESQVNHHSSNLALHKQACRLTAYFEFAGRTQAALLLAGQQSIRRKASTILGASKSVVPQARQLIHKGHNIGQQARHITALAMHSDTSSSDHQAYKRRREGLTITASCSQPAACNHATAGMHPVASCIETAQARKASAVASHSKASKWQEFLEEVAVPTEATACMQSGQEHNCTASHSESRPFVTCLD